ncbi:uncharacterized protein LOC111374832 [Olea europaea var. sylvestris]|uniref:uncharacterized protein LOC111374832 n=1 Tax=Olea europaea var. sylvestris TaxID=158386 RepID=UPI000C1CEF90|nr:uncharacterized protein LOC111374832 [Olea europaea var. sylvestris]
MKYKHLRELLNSTGVEYISHTGTINGPDEWWERKIQENKDYREFRDKDCREVYSYKVLLEDAYDSDKYAITPSTMCKTSFSMFEDSRHEDLQDSQPLDEEGSASSD